MNANWYEESAGGSCGTAHFEAPRPTPSIAPHSYIWEMGRHPTTTSWAVKREKAGALKRCGDGI